MPSKLVMRVRFPSPALAFQGHVSSLRSASCCLPWRAAWCRSVLTARLKLSHSNRQMEHVDQAPHIVKPWKRRMFSQVIHIRSKLANGVVEPAFKAVSDRQ
jgi:hypothetical protein